MSDTPDLSPCAGHEPVPSLTCKQFVVELLTQYLEHTTDPGALQKGADFVQAFCMGFDVADAVALLRLDDLYVFDPALHSRATLRLGYVPELHCDAARRELVVVETSEERRGWIFDPSLALLERNALRTCGYRSFHYLSSLTLPHAISSAGLIYSFIGPCYLFLCKKNCRNTAEYFTGHG